MGAKRCDRCGTSVEAGRVVCPACDNVVDLSFLGESTRAGFDDDSESAAAGFDDGFDSATLTTTKLARGTVEESEPTPTPTPKTPPKAPPPPRQPPKPVKSAEEIEAARVPSFLNEATEADGDLEELLRSSTDALVLGDASNIVESLWVEESLTLGGIAGSGDDGRNQDFLTAATEDGVRDIVPVQVYVGGDIARLLERDVVLEKARELDGLTLSSFETYVLAQIDGKRPVARIQRRMGLTEADVRIALALLVDKKLVRRSGRATPVGAAGPAKGDVDVELELTLVPPRATTELPSVPRPAQRHVAGPDATLAMKAPQPMAATPSFLTPVEPVVDDLAASTVGSFADDPVEPTVPQPTLRAPRPTELPEQTTFLTPPNTMPLPAAMPPPLPRAPTPVPMAPLPRAPTPVPMAPLPRLPTPQPSSLPTPSSTTAAPPMMALDPSSLRTGLVVDDSGRSRAATLYAQCLRDLKNGSVARAFAIARMAHDAAPDVALYKEILDNWNAFVDQHKTADDARLHAQAVNAESTGDVNRAVALLRQATKANPRNAAAWNRLGLLLATRLKDIDGALEAMSQAIELAPNDATFKNNFGKIAAMAERRGPTSTSVGGLFQKLFGR